ncbi:hypothetical protein CLV62_11789 [Dysgonomonas alginatilytica]|uniref:Uncharacterized protein n=1 Tax=Dysgonomonas alginatilytica TaxID=1605892 RepID=A0A2V3PPR9_9BACT|nr:hypothetical protein [Dysgonomonas alginatilytica]PXV62873.1 hypothetical protein CLV62_11789 [Dysgonomonas alginatilytica]
MDLDNIKKSWNENNVLPALSEDKIHNIINKRAKTALDKLVFFEIFGCLILIPLLLLPYLHGIAFPQMPYPVFTKYFYFATCIVGFIWQIYKYKLLKKINISHTTIARCSIYMSEYKLSINRERIVGVLFILIFIFSFAYSYTDLVHGEQEKLKFCIFNIILFVLACSILLFYYKLAYYKRIKFIEASLREAREMENG